MRADLPDAYTVATDVLAAWQRDYAGPQHAGRETLHAALDTAISALRALRDAPKVEITECNQIAGASDFDWGDLSAAVQKFKPGQFVRLVVVGEEG